MYMKRMKGTARRRGSSCSGRKPAPLKIVTIGPRPTIDFPGENYCRSMIRGSAVSGTAPPLRVVVGLEPPGLADLPTSGRFGRARAAMRVGLNCAIAAIAFRLEEDRKFPARFPCWSASTRRPAGRCRAPSTSRRSSGPSTWPSNGRRRGLAGCRRPRLPQAFEDAGLDLGEVDHRLAGGVLQAQRCRVPDAPGDDILW